MRLCMRKVVRRIFVCIAILFFAVNCFGQDTYRPSVAYVYPAGAQIGSTVRVLFGGIRLNDAEEVIVSGDGITAKIIEYIRPLRQGEVARTRLNLEKKFAEDNPEVKEKIKELGVEGQRYLRRETMKIPENKKIMADADKSYYLRLLSTDALAETLEVELQIAPNADLGMRQILVRTKSGLSKPKNFIISDMSEVTKPSLRKTAIERSKSPLYKWGAYYMARTKYVGQPFSEIEITPPVIANGQITEGSVDVYKFKANKGETFHLAVDAQKLIPYISDAVPGWFQTVIRVFDCDGNEVAYNDDYYFFPDSRLSFTAQKDGAYKVEIHDAIYRSREDFVYRLTIAKTPLPNVIANFVAPEKPKKSLLFEYGIISKTRQQNSYELVLKKNQRVIAEVFARRQNSPLDSFLSITDSSGKRIRINDDFYDETSGLTTHHSDSRIDFTPKSDGKYTFHVSDTIGSASLYHSYVLSVCEPSIDFKILSYNSSASVRKDGILSFKLKVFREYGKLYPITLTANLPEGWKILNPIIRSKDTEHELLIKPNDNFATLPISVFATVKTKDETIKREVLPADYLMQAFYYRHFVPAISFFCSVSNNIKHFSAQKNMKFLYPKDKDIAYVPLDSVLRLPIAITPKHHYWKVVPTIKSNIVEVGKVYWSKNHLYVEIKPTKKAKEKDRDFVHINLFYKTGNKLMEFDRTPPYRFVVCNKDKSNKKTKPNNKKQSKKQASNKNKQVAKK
ncbi:MAG: pre-peptidase C-terminal domain-containing protein [Opitutales bacterium]|nr:pre-peptidase C-terminal domain-containing protein [Opitutales bacterium]